MAKRHGEFAHLSADSQAFCARLRRKYQLSEHHVRLVAMAGEANDRRVEARALLERDGLVQQNRHGELRPHPAVAIERDSAIRFARLLRELALEDEIPSAARPPRLPGRRYGRAS